MALSSREAELNSAAKAISEIIGVIELLRAWGCRVDLPKLKIDASECYGILLRRGVGKLNHLATQQV